MIERYPSLAHWGAFTALVENGRVVGCEPFRRDPAPSPMINAIPAMVHSPLRVARPAIREGWREGRERTGHDAFREVSWDEALERRRLGSVAGAREIRPRRPVRRLARLVVGRARASRAHAGAPLHVARRRLRQSVGNYSFGAAMYLLPHIIGTMEPVGGPRHRVAQS